MSTFSTMPRFPAESAEADSPPQSDNALGHAVAVVQFAGELLLFTSPIVGCLWLIASLPVLLVLMVVTAGRDEPP